MQSQPPFGDWMLLHQEEHEQEQKSLQLLVAQTDGNCQLNHWHSPLTMLAGLPTVEVGIYKAPCRALALGLPRMALSDGSGGFSIPHWFCSRNLTEPNLATFSGLSARISGATTPENRYPARGSARVTPMKHNLKSPLLATHYKTPNTCI